MCKKVYLGDDFYVYTKKGVIVNTLRYEDKIVHKIITILSIRVYPDNGLHGISTISVQYPPGQYPPGQSPPPPL